MKQIIATTIALSVALGVCIQALAADRPPTPLTGAYVSDIDQDWVELTVNKGGGISYTLDEAETLVDTIFKNQRMGNEIADLAHFSCTLYRREGVYLSYDMDITIHRKGGFKVATVSSIYFLFACAIPAGR